MPLLNVNQLQSVLGQLNTALALEFVLLPPVLEWIPEPKSTGISLLPNRQHLQSFTY